MKPFVKVTKHPNLSAFSAIQEGECFLYNNKEYIKINKSCGLCVDPPSDMSILHEQDQEFSVQKTGTATIDINIRRP